MAQIYDERLGRPGGRRRRRTRRSSSSIPASERALKALDDLFTRQKMWSELAENLESQLALAATDEAQLALMLRLAALRETEMGLVDVGHRGLPPGPRARHRRRQQALARARAARAGAGARARRSPTCSSRSTATSATGRSSSGCTRCRSAAARTSTRRVELLHQIAQLYEDAAGDLELRVRHARARPQGGPGATRRRSSSSIASPARPGASRISRSVFAAARRRRSERPDARERALHDERARPGERPRQPRHRDRPLPQGPRDRPAQPRGRGVARAPVPRDGALPGAVASSCSASRRSSRSRTTRRTRSSRPRRSRRTSSTSPRRRSPSTSKVLEIDSDDVRAHRRAHPPLPRPVALAGPARGLREEGGSRRRRRREEGHLLPGRRGLRARARRRAARDRHVHEDPRARSRRPPGALAPRRPLRAGAELDGAPLACSRARAR